MRNVYIYGDSLLKATVPDEELKYHFHLPEIMARYPSDRVQVTNRAKMGATVSKGLSLVETLESMLNVLYRQGVQPVLMSLPPIDPRRYLNFICRNGLDRSAILRWLGDEDMIYRHQELYSDTVTELAYANSVPLIHVRQAFLADHHMNDMLSADGIHMTMEGYGKLFDTLADWLRPKLDQE